MLMKTVVALRLGYERKIEMIKNRINSSLKDETGATTVEYALIIAVIVVGVIAAASAMFTPLETFFKSVVTKIQELVS